MYPAPAQAAPGPVPSDGRNAVECCARIAPVYRYRPEEGLGIHIVAHLVGVANNIGQGLTKVRIQPSSFGLTLARAKLAAGGGCLTRYNAYFFEGQGQLLSRKQRCIWYSSPDDKSARAYGYVAAQVTLKRVRCTIYISIIPCLP